MLACLRSHLRGLNAQVLQFDGCDSVAAAATHILEQPRITSRCPGSRWAGLPPCTSGAAPERVPAVALLESTALPVPEALWEVRRAQAARARYIGLRSYLEQHLWPDYVAETPLGYVALLDEMRGMAASLGIETYLRQTDLALSRPDARPLLPSLHMPALVVAGDEDRVCPPGVQQALAAALPHATLAMLPGAGHFAVMEKPDVVAAHVAAWFHTLARR